MGKSKRVHCKTKKKEGTPERKGEFTGKTGEKRTDLEGRQASGKKQRTPWREQRASPFSLSSRIEKATRRTSNWEATENGSSRICTSSLTKYQKPKRKPLLTFSQAFSIFFYFFVWSKRHPSSGREA